MHDGLHTRRAIARVRPVSRLWSREAIEMIEEPPRTIKNDLADQERSADENGG
jgi:hypothetical protein